MTSKSTYENDLNYAMQTTRVVLRMIGGWPLSNRSSNAERILARLLNVVCYVLFLATLIPGLLRIFLKEKSPRIRLKMFGPMFNCFVCLVKYTILVYRAHEISECLRKMKEDWKEAARLRYRSTMLSRAKVGRKLGVLSAVFMYGGGIPYRTVVPLSRGTIVTAENVTIRPLACPSYFLKFDEQQSPAYEIVFAIQFFAGFVSFSVSCGVCGLAALFVMHVCGQLKILILKMRELSEGGDYREDRVGWKLADIVRHQIRIKNFLKEVETVMQYMCLVEMVGCTCLMCLVGYYVIMEWESSDRTAMLTYFVLFVSFMFSVFVFCYIGQLLTDQSTEVAVMSSTINWYQFSVKKARCIVLIIAMSYNPSKITAGQMMDMSMVSFGNIIKASVGYFNILRKTI
ncbi:hypothetical protein KM043_005926 [Ampulex compressa]|nr:hypothetical protein KM043_005926 [Ampulex compressa]